MAKTLFVHLARSCQVDKWPKPPLGVWPDHVSISPDQHSVELSKTLPAAPVKKGFVQARSTLNRPSRGIVCDRAMITWLVCYARVTSTLIKLSSIKGGVRLKSAPAITPITPNPITKMIGAGERRQPNF
jgi:hypothetical protein